MFLPRLVWHASERGKSEEIREKIFSGTSAVITCDGENFCVSKGKMCVFDTGRVCKREGWAGQVCVCVRERERRGGGGRERGRRLGEKRA